MQKSESYTPLGESIVGIPKGFIQWYEIQERMKSQVFLIIENLLIENKSDEAVGIFETETEYNPKKVWH